LHELVKGIARRFEDQGRGHFGIFLGAGIRVAVLSLLKRK
jgi:hypothetical protein